MNLGVVIRVTVFPQEENTAASCIFFVANLLITAGSFLFVLLVLFVTFMVIHVFVDCRSRKGFWD